MGALPESAGSGNTGTEYRRGYSVVLVVSSERTDRGGFASPSEISVVPGGERPSFPCRRPGADQSFGAQPRRTFDLPAGDRHWRPGTGDREAVAPCASSSVPSGWQPSLIAEPLQPVARCGQQCALLAAADPDGLCVYQFGVKSRVMMGHSGQIQRSSMMIPWAVSATSTSSSTGSNDLSTTPLATSSLTTTRTASKWMPAVMSAPCCVVSVTSVATSGPASLARLSSASSANLRTRSVGKGP